MTLEFQPPYQLQNPQVRKDQQAQQFNQNLMGLGQMAMQYSQQQKENKIRQAMLALQQQQGQREQGAYNFEYGDPNAPIDNPGYSPQTGQPMTMARPQNMSMLPPQGNYGGDSGGNPTMGPQPTGSLQQGSMGPQAQLPPGTGYSSQTGQPMTMAPRPGQPLHQPGTDLTSHFQAWQSQGQPARYNHPEMGGQPQGPNANDPYGLGANMSQIGSKRYALLHQEAQAGAGARVLGASPLAKSIFGNASPQDLELSGINAGETIPKLAELQSSMNYKNAMLSNAGQRLTNEAQLPAQTKASTLYNDYVTKGQTLDSASTALAQAATNPAAFSTALLSVGQALGVNSRNPQMIIGTIAAGNPSLAGRLNEALTKGVSGQLTPDLKNALDQQMGNLKQANQQSFEQKANAHAQQNAKYYGGDINQAKSALFPTYQFGGGQGGRMIRVRNKQTGQTGQMPAGNFDATKYDQLQ